MSISLALEHKINCHWSIILLDQTVLLVDRRDGLGGGRLFEGGDYFTYFRLRDAINQGTAIIRGNMVVWVFCTIKWRGKKCKREKEEGVPAIRTCVFACCPPGSQMSTVTTWPSTFHFSVYRDVNNVLVKGITDSWGQIPPKSKHHSPQNGHD